MGFNSGFKGLNKNCPSVLSRLWHGEF